MGRRVVVHTMTPDRALAHSLRLELNLLSVPLFPRKLQTFRFFRQVQQALPSMAKGLQIAFSRVPVRDIAVCGGTHRGYLTRTRRWTGPFDLLQFWMENQCYRHARVTVAHSDLIADELTAHYRFERNKIPILYPPVDERFTRIPETPSRAELRKKFDWPANKVVFLFPSKGHRNKGLHRICEALQPFADQAILAVAGKPPGHSQASF